MHKVDGESSGEESDEITMSQVTGFYKEMFNELKPKKQEGSSQQQEESRSFDGSHMD